MNLPTLTASWQVIRDSCPAIACPGKQASDSAGFANDQSPVPLAGGCALSAFATQLPALCLAQHRDPGKSYGLYRLRKSEMHVLMITSFHLVSTVRDASSHAGQCAVSHLETTGQSQGLSPRRAPLPKARCWERPRD